MMSPYVTPFTTIHNVFACFGTPAVTWEPMRVDIHSGTKVSDSLETAFNDPVSEVKYQLGSFY